jgi:ADP-ribosylglycohydrolase
MTADRVLLIRRVLSAACVGDALGAATEGMHPDEIRRVFGGRVAALHAAPAAAPFAKGLAPGSLTDDATQMLAMAHRIVAARGRPTLDDAVAAMIEWASDAEMFTRFAGPTTRIAIERLRAGIAPDAVATPDTYSCTYGTSNGAAMRAPAAGCACVGDIEGAAALACLLARPTHNTQIAFAGAAAVAAAIAAGLGGMPGTLADWADRGAALGEEEATRTGRVAGGVGIRRRLEMALRIGEVHAGDVDAAAAELTDTIGNGVAMAEAVPHAFGLVAAARGDAWQAILAAVNGGNDSDTIAMIAGAIAAAASPADTVPPAVVAEVVHVNRLDLDTIAAALSTLPTRETS